MIQIRGVFRARGYELGPRAVVRKSAADQPAKREWVIEDDAWRYPIRDPGATNTMFSVYPAPQTSTTNDTLEVFPEHVNTVAYRHPGGAVFPFNLPLSLGKEEANIFLKAKDVRQHEVLEAFTLRRPRHRLRTAPARSRYLNLSTSEAAAIMRRRDGGPPLLGLRHRGVGVRSRGPTSRRRRDRHLDASC